MNATRIKTEFGTRRAGSARSHKLPICEATGLARYRDRHQALQGARTIRAGVRDIKIATFACPDCRGTHLEMSSKGPTAVVEAVEPVPAFTASLGSRRRRYILVDIENPTRGAKATGEEVARFWEILKQEAPGIAPHDHVVVGASRRVARKYRAMITGPNVKWVIGADAPDGADRALLAAIDLYQVARDYDEVVIVSGDHAFIDLAVRAKSRGLSVQVVTAEQPGGRSMLARGLADAADTRTLVRLAPLKRTVANLTPMIAARRIHSASIAA